jgi:hypothetical protein
MAIRNGSQREAVVRDMTTKRELPLQPTLPQAEADLGATSLPNPSQPTGPAPSPPFPVLEPERSLAPAEAFSRPVLSVPWFGLVVLGCLGLATLWSIGFGVSLVWRALRRQPERNWP